MSERKKRLTDAEVRAAVRDYRAQELLDDHLQAREDVQRLAAMLARILTQSTPAALLDEAERLLVEVGE